MTELLDIYDENMVHIGIKPRPQVHRDGDWHKVFHCWVIYRDADGDDWIIVQKRGPYKASFPNMFDVSAAGHYAAGETPSEGMRELQEELGLFPAFEELIPVGTRITSSGYGNEIDREIADVFFYICDQPLAEYCYQEEEVQGLIALNVDQALRLFTGEIDTLDAPACGFETSTLTITKHHFILSVDRYWEKVCLLTRRCLDGERRLLRV